jgi:hypothetical protein
MFIVFCAPVVSHDQAYVTTQLPEHVVKDLAGLASSDPDDELVQYLIDEEPTSPLVGLPITEGRLSMVLRGQQLHICATYTLTSSLSAPQVDALRTYTSNHFSDGAGESWKQQLWSRHKIPLEIVWQDISLVAP